jgi:transporter family protein
MNNFWNSWWVYALLSGIFAGITAILAKLGVKGVDSDLAMAIRTSVILVLVWMIAYFRGSTHSFSSLSTQNWIFLGLSGLATGASWLFYFRALKLGEVSKVAPVDKLSVVFALVFAMIFLGEKPQIQTLLGAALILIGGLVILL